MNLWVYRNELLERVAEAIAKERHRLEGKTVGLIAPEDKALARVAVAAMSTPTVWEAMEELPDWNGRRNDFAGLSTYWAQRARKAEAMPTLTPEEARALFYMAFGGEHPNHSGGVVRSVSRKLSLIANGEGKR